MLASRRSDLTSTGPTLWWRAAFVIATLTASAMTLGASRITSARLDEAWASDVRTVTAGLWALGLLALGLRLAVVGWLATTAPGHRLDGPRVRRWHRAATLLVAVASGLAVIGLVESSPLHRVAVATLTAVSAGAAIAMTPAMAELLEQERWLRLGAITMVGPMARLAVTWLVVDGRHPLSGIAPIAVADVVTVLAARRLRPSAPSLIDVLPGRRYLLSGAVAATGLLVTVAMASIALRGQLGPDADVYNSSGAAARLVGYLPLTMAMLSFPSLARAPIGSPRLRTTYLRTMAWSATPAIVTSVVLLAAPTTILTALDLPVGDSAVTTLRLLSLAWLLLAASITPILFAIARGSRLALIAWAGTGVLAAGHIVATTPTALAGVAALGALTLLAAVTVPALARIGPVIRTMASPADRRERLGAQPVTVVVPCYNPGPVVATTLTEIHEVLTRASFEVRILVVTDGSTDGSDDLIDTVRIDGLRHLRHPMNRGKGAALRTGFEHALSDPSGVIAFIDADGDLSPSLLLPLIAVQQATGADIVFGSKMADGSTIDMSRGRRITSAGFRMLVRSLFRLDISDTQTGLKVLRSEVVHAILPTLRDDGFTVDLELFVAAKAAGFDRFAETPVVLKRTGSSTLRARSVGGMLAQTLRLFWRAHATLEYDRSATALAPATSAR